MGIPTIAKCMSGTARSIIMYPFHNFVVTPPATSNNSTNSASDWISAKKIGALRVSHILLWSRFVSLEPYVRQKCCYQNIWGDPLTRNKRFKPHCSVLFRNRFCPNKGKFQLQSRESTSIPSILYLVYCPMQTTQKSL